MFNKNRLKPCTIFRMKNGTKIQINWKWVKKNVETRHGTSLHFLITIFFCRQNMAVVLQCPEDQHQHEHHGANDAGDP